MLKFELQKVFQQKTIYVFGLIFLAIYCLFFFQTIPQIEEGQEEWRQLKKEWDDPITETDIKWYKMGVQAYEQAVKNEEKVNGFLTYLPSLQHRHVDLTKYSDTAIGLLIFQLSRATHVQEEQFENKQWLMNHQEQDQFSYRKIALSNTMLESLSPIEVRDITGWEQNFQLHKQFALIFFGGLLMIGILPVFIQDHAQQTLAFVMSSKDGKSKIVTTKIVAVFIYILVITMFYTLLHIGVVQLTYGLTNGDASLRSLLLFTNTPFDWSIYQFSFYQFVTLLFGGLSFGSLVMLMSCYFRSTIITLLSVSIVLFSPSLLQFILSSEDKLLILFSYKQIFQVHGLFNEFRVFSLFNYPVFYHFMMFGIFTCITVICLYCLYYIYKRQPA